ncbi:MAG: Rrf2 family transcriptional regulator [Proteobacteria bacterium]|nr:Rrf2 family transcriptional regulator [Pseudomonadota bacterium]NCA28328.1 Rrf2 family transcriptional regulator [Pseudomonadota bacterium]
MILTTKARYAVMAVIEIASQNSSKPISLNEISKSQNISLSYLEQIFVSLRKNNIVKSIKGPGGGYILSKNKSEISVSDIIKAIDEPIKMTRCSIEKQSCNSNKTKCKTHHLWHGLENRIYDYLNSISLEKL